MKRAAKLFGARFNPNSRLSLMAKKADGKKLQVTEKTYSAACTVYLQVIILKYVIVIFLSRSVNKDVNQRS